MYEVIFLWALALAYLAFAVVQDIRQREIANWINFSLLVFALGFRLFYSLFSEDWNFFLNGAIGFGIFFVIGNLFYYGRIFAGGDAKMIIALGAILPVFSEFSMNLKIFFNFLILFLVCGFVYIMISSIFLCIKNFRAFRKEFVRQLRKNRKIVFFSLLLSIVLAILGLAEKIFFALGLLIFFILYLYTYTKAVDEACMVVRLKTKNLTEGDWLYSDVRIGRKIIKAKWAGLTKSEIKEIAKRYKEVKIRQGVPFSPVILASFITCIILYFLKINLWDSFWKP